MEQTNTIQISKKKSIAASLIMFAAVILALIFVATPIQIYFGMVGVLLTELLLLAMAIVGAIIMKTPLKEVFPLGIPRIRQTIGTIILWLAAYLLVLFSTILLGFFFPEQVSGVSEGLNSVISSVPLWARFLIVAVSPAICEEAVHRGFILHFLKPVEKKWLIVTIMGILFGIFHLDPFRFLPTALLGGIISYVAIETKNMFYPFLIHFINNALSVLATKMTENANYSEVSTEAAFSLAVLGTYLLLMCVTPWLFWLGNSLIHPKPEQKRKGKLKKVLICFAISAFCIVGGSVLSVVGVMTTAVLNVTETTTVSDLAETPYAKEFDIESDGSQMLTVVLTSTPEKELCITITDDSGSVVYEATAASLTGNISLDLKAGHYTLNVSVAGEPNIDSTVAFNFILQNL